MVGQQISLLARRNLLAHAQTLSADVPPTYSAFRLLAGKSDFQPYHKLPTPDIFAVDAVANVSAAIAGFRAGGHAPPRFLIQGMRVML